MDASNHPPRAPSGVVQLRELPLFTGTPSHVAKYLAAHMPKQPNRVALLTAGLTHLASEWLPTDSLCVVLSNGHKVTIRP
jgi:hypothetical protein